ncbi:MAG: hypothetical protein RIR80_108 [Bacteroidota bacterium]
MKTLLKIASIAGLLGGMIGWALLFIGSTKINHH